MVVCIVRKLNRLNSHRFFATKAGKNTKRYLMTKYSYEGLRPIKLLHAAIENVTRVELHFVEKNLNSIKARNEHT